MTAWATCASQPVRRVLLHVPTQGPWWADVDFEGAPDVAGMVTLALGELELVGTVDARETGTHALERRLRIVAGAGGWGTLLAARAYHNDAGVLARSVLEDAAREAGETLDASAAPSAARLAVDYVREAGPASRVLEEAIGSASWWVAYDGTTHVGARSEAAADVGTYEVLDFEPRSHVVTLAADDLASVGVGSVLSERLDEPQTVRELEIEASGDGIRARAWCGTAARRGRLADAVSTVVERLTDRRIWGARRYRVVQMSSDRVELQVVRRASGLPDVLPVSMHPGAPGVHADLTPGAEVLVQFEDGSRELPFISHFMGKDGVGWAPVNLTLDATSTIKAGANATKAPAWAIEIRAELVKIAGALAQAQASPGGGPLTWAPGTDYPVAGIPAASALGAAKVRVE